MNVDHNLQRLSFTGKLLENNKTLADYNIKQESILQFWTSNLEADDGEDCDESMERPVVDWSEQEVFAKQKVDAELEINMIIFLRSRLKRQKSSYFKERIGQAEVELMLTQAEAVRL